MKADQERVAKLLNDTVTLLCKNGLIYKNNLTVQGLLGITLDKNEVFIVHINESIGASATVDNIQKQKQTLPPITNVVDLTKIADPPITPSHQHQQSTLRYHNTVSSPVLGQPRKQRPQMINQTMLLQRNELLQQVQNRLRMNTSMMPQAMGPMGPMPVPIAPMPMYQPRQPVSRPSNHRQRPIINPRRPSSLQQNQAPISLLDEDDVVIVGTGREEPHSSPRRSQGARIGRNPQPSKNFRMHSNESQPIVIPQDCAPFHDASLGMGATYPPHRMQTMEGLHPGFVEPKNFLGEIVIEPTNSSDVDITAMLGFPRSSRRMEDCQMEVGGPHGGAEVHSDVRKPEENNPQDRVTVYLDVADDGAQNDFKPCYSNMEAQQKGQSRVDDTPREFRKAGEETINLDSLGLHMLTEGEDDPHMSASSWHCKVPTCQAFYAESSQLASHYIHEHSQQLDLSIKDSAGTETSEQPEIDADASCPEAWQDSSRAETDEDPTACPSTRSDETSESNDRHEKAPGSVVRSLSINSSHKKPRLDEARAVHSMWMKTSSINRAETRTHSLDEPDSRQEAVSLPEDETFPEMTSFIQPQEQVQEATTLTNTQNDTGYLRRDFLPLNINPGTIVDHFSIPGNPENQMLQIVPEPQQPLCFDEATDPRDASFSGNRREAGTDFDRMECDPTRTFEEARRADDDSSRSPCLTMANVDDNL